MDFKISEFIEIVIAPLPIYQVSASCLFKINARIMKFVISRSDDVTFSGSTRLQRIAMANLKNSKELCTKWCRCSSILYSGFSYLQQTDIDFSSKL